MTDDQPTAGVALTKAVEFAWRDYDERARLARSNRQWTTAASAQEIANGLAAAITALRTPASGAVEAIQSLIDEPLTGPTHDVWERARRAGLKEALVSVKRAALTSEPKAEGETCNMGVGCDDYGRCYAAENGQPDRCGRPQPLQGGEVTREALELLVRTAAETIKVTRGPMGSFYRTETPPESLYALSVLLNQTVALISPAQREGRGHD